ncbi:putative tail protein [Staphylococcus phage vB_SauM_VL10]|nr:putative tail protein [Staphylococcus phage vB_SauM_VL10]
MSTEQLREKNNKSETKNLKTYSNLLDRAQQIIEDAKALDSGGSDSSSDSGGSASDVDGEGAGKIYKFLKGKGLSDNQVGAVMGNLKQESGLDPNAKNASSGAFGIAQWLGSRKSDLDSFAKSKGKKSNDLDVQLDFLWKEMSSGQNSDMLKNAGWSKSGSLEKNTKAFATGFERMGAGEAMMSTRVNNAKSYVSKYGKSGGGGGGGIPSSYTSVLRNPMLSSSAGSNTSQNSVSVSVNITGTNDKSDAEEIGKGIKSTFGDDLDIFSNTYKRNY